MKKYQKWCIGIGILLILTFISSFESTELTVGQGVLSLIVGLALLVIGSGKGKVTIETKYNSSGLNGDRKDEQKRIAKNEIEKNEDENIILAEALFDSISTFTIDINLPLKYKRKIQEIQRDASIGRSTVDRQMLLDKVIELVGNPTTAKQLYLLSYAYVWSKSSYRKEAIKYMELYLSGGEYYTQQQEGNWHAYYSRPMTKKEAEDMHLSELYGYLGKAYEGEYLFDKALEYYYKQKDLDEPMFYTHIFRISRLLVKMNELEKSKQFVIEAKKRAKNTCDATKRGFDREIEDIEAKIKKGYVYKPRRKTNN